MALAASPQLPRDDHHLVADWNVSRVCEWLSELGPAFANYAYTFSAHSIRGSELLGLGSAALANMGITIEMHRAEIARQVQQLDMMHRENQMHAQLGHYEPPPPAVLQLRDDDEDASGSLHLQYGPYPFHYRGGKRFVAEKLDSPMAFFRPAPAAVPAVATVAKRGVQWADDVKDHESADDEEEEEVQPRFTREATAYEPREAERPPLILNMRIFRLIVKIQQKFHKLRLRAQTRTKASLLRQQMATEMEMQSKLKGRAPRARRMTGGEWISGQQRAEEEAAARFTVQPMYLTHEIVSSSVVQETLSTTSSTAIAASRSLAAPARERDGDNSSNGGAINLRMLRIISRIQRSFLALKQRAQQRVREKLLRAQLDTERALREKLMGRQKSRRQTGAEWLKAQVQEDARRGAAIDAHRAVVAASAQDDAHTAAVHASRSLALSSRTAPSVSSVRVWALIVRIQQKFHALRAKAQEKLKRKMVMQQMETERALQEKLKGRTTRNKRVSGGEWIASHFKAEQERRAQFTVQPMFETHEVVSSGFARETLTPSSPAASSRPLPQLSTIKSPPRGAADDLRSGVLNLCTLRMVARVQKQFHMLRVRAQQRLKDKMLAAQLGSETEFANKLKGRAPRARRMTGGEWLKAQLAEDAARDADRRHARTQIDPYAAKRASMEFQPSQVSNLKVWAMIVRIQQKFHALRKRAQEKMRDRLVDNKLAQERKMEEKLRKLGLAVEQTKRPPPTTTAATLIQSPIEAPIEVATPVAPLQPAPVSPASVPSRRSSSGNDWLRQQLEEAQRTIAVLVANQAKLMSPPSAPVVATEAPQVVVDEPRDVPQLQSPVREFSFAPLPPRTPTQAQHRREASASGEWIYHAVDDSGNEFVLQPIPLADHQRQQQSQHRPSPPLPRHTNSHSPLPTSSSYGVSLSPPSLSPSHGAGGFSPSPPSASNPRFVNIKLVERSKLSPRTARVQSANGVEPTAYDYQQEQHQQQHHVPMVHPHYAQLTAPYGYGPPPHQAYPPPGHYYGYPPAPYPHPYPPPHAAYGYPPAPYPYPHQPYPYHAAHPPPPLPSSHAPPHHTPHAIAPQEPVAYDDHFAHEPTPVVHEQPQSHSHRSPPPPQPSQVSPPREQAPSRPQPPQSPPRTPTAAQHTHSTSQHHIHSVSPRAHRLVSGPSSSSPPQPQQQRALGVGTTSLTSIAPSLPGYSSEDEEEIPSDQTTSEFLRQKKLRREYLRWSQARATSATQQPSTKPTANVRSAPSPRSVLKPSPVAIVEPEIAIVVIPPAADEDEYAEEVFEESEPAAPAPTALAAIPVQAQRLARHDRSASELSSRYIAAAVAKAAAWSEEKEVVPMTSAAVPQVPPRAYLRPTSAYTARAPVLAPTTTPMPPSALNANRYPPYRPSYYTQSAAGAVSPSQAAATKRRAAYARK